jgi:hypothetical protein
MVKNTFFLSDNQRLQVVPNLAVVRYSSPQRDVTIAMTNRHTSVAADYTPWQRHSELTTATYELEHAGEMTWYARSLLILPCCEGRSNL